MIRRRPSLTTDRRPSAAASDWAKSVRVSEGSSLASRPSIACLSVMNSSGHSGEVWLGLLVSSTATLVEAGRSLSIRLLRSAHSFLKIWSDPIRWPAEQLSSSTNTTDSAPPEVRPILSSELQPVKRPSAMPISSTTRQRMASRISSSMRSASCSS